MVLGLQPHPGGCSQQILQPTDFTRRQQLSRFGRWSSSTLRDTSRSYDAASGWAPEPMGDLSQFVIDDLTSDEEDEFFRILEDA